MTIPSAPDPEQLAAFDRDGLLILRDALAPEVRDRAAEAAVRLLATDRTAGRDRSVDGKDGFRGAVALDDAFLPLLANPAVLPTLVGLLSPNLYLLSSNLIAMPSLPDEERTIRVPARHGWHRDMSSTAADLGIEQTPRLAIKVAYVLTDPGPDAGLTMFVPGSHTRTGLVTVPQGDIDPPGAITPDIGPHDVVLFENRTWHAGGLNRSGRTRLAVMMQYGFRWLNAVDDPAPGLLDRPGLDHVERQLLGARDRHPDGSVAREGSGARPLTAWWEHLNAASAR
ncbi:phytanoyl-CoA dioxygenase family protein [Streptomyces lydicus]|uniref:phytanoyl-CoA dioxygenase family protein n=1 Tax=Streptomyces lydicus TaxID=47763 RepID=UPI00101240F2|nr:phytanoyl-CoA dioxygenase family protein [Streptomyces lydicus]MCZ1008435.1 phytanoyl-CoA dioxygenase family protein [Streptomyces lydicus]